MRTRHSFRRVVGQVPRWLSLACWVLSVWTFPAQAAESLQIGSKRFTESYVLAEILAQTATASGQTRIRLRQGLGNTAIVHQALKSGEIDLYVDYTGTISRELLRTDAELDLAAISDALAPSGLGAAIPLGFSNGYALAMRADQADRLGIRTLSDLARFPDLRLALSNEFLGRADGWPAVADRYGLTHQASGLDHGLAFDALATQRCDVIDIYTTDAQIVARDLRVLQDDRQVFPSYQAVVLYRLDVPDRFARAWQALTRLQGSISEADMIAMNARAEVDGERFSVIAQDFLQHDAGASAVTPSPPASGPMWWRKLIAPDLWRLTREHLALVFGSVMVAALLAIPAGIAVAARPHARAVILGMTGLLQTVPSLAMLAVLITVTGSIGVVPALLALMLYALLPIMRNTCIGLAEVPPGLRSAALALGMSGAQSKRHVELALAMPSIIAGIRTATTICIGTATIAAFIGAGGYGERIVTGLALNDHALLLAGAIPAALLAVVCEGLFEWAERRWSVRGAA